MLITVASRLTSELIPELKSRTEINRIQLIKPFDPDFQR